MNHKNIMLSFSKLTASQSKMITRIKFHIHWEPFNSESKDSIQSFIISLIHQYKLILIKIQPYETKGKVNLIFSEFIKSHSHADRLITSIQLIILNLISWSYVLKSKCYDADDHRRLIKFLNLLKENPFKNPLEKEWKFISRI
jgi:hypothetical protein